MRSEEIVRNRNQRDVWAGEKFRRMSGVTRSNPPLRAAKLIHVISVGECQDFARRDFKGNIAESLAAD